MHHEYAKYRRSGAEHFASGSDIHDTMIEPLVEILEELSVH
jgi:hypothetical protein